MNEQPEHELDEFDPHRRRDSAMARVWAIASLQVVRSFHEAWKDLSSEAAAAADVPEPDHIEISIPYAEMVSVLTAPPGSPANRLVQARAQSLFDAASQSAKQEGAS